VTLCIAAACYKGRHNRIVICADKRTEVDWASGNVGWKFSFASDNWPILLSGDTSKAAGLITTCREVIKDGEGITYDNISDKLNKVSSRHKHKLCDQYIRQGWGISFERFLTKGQIELTPEVRNRIFHDLGELRFDCDITIIGFTSGVPCIFTIHNDGEVVGYENFAAIGTGSLIAESVLFQREQQSTDSFERTLYNVYEAARLGRIAPGVGDTQDFLLVSPPIEDDSHIGISSVTRKGLGLLDETFKTVGPKALIDVPVITDEHFLPLDWGDIKAAKGLQVTLYGSKPPREP
jgi:hypothetical protein